MSCYQDMGSLCNFTGPQAYCMLNYTNSQLCDTQDGVSCYNYASGWYLTNDQKTLTSTFNLTTQNTNAGYCYSNDGISCYSDYGLGCNTSNNNYLCSTSD